MKTAVTLVVWAAVLLLLVTSVRRFLHRRGLKRMGDKQYAVVRYVSGTGSRDRNFVSLLVTLEYTAGDGQSYRRDITRTYDIGNMPRRGDRMSIWVNPNDSSDFDVAEKDPIPPGYTP